MDKNRYRNKCLKRLQLIVCRNSLKEVSVICHLSVCSFSWQSHQILLLFVFRNLRVRVPGNVELLSKSVIFLNPRRTLGYSVIAVSPGSEPLVVLYKGGKCPVKDNGQMMKVPAPAAVVPMRIREILRCQNQRNKRSENNPRLRNSRRNPPNCPAKQQPNYPPVRRGKDAIHSLAVLRIKCNFVKSGMYSVNTPFFNHHFLWISVSSLFLQCAN